MIPNFIVVGSARAGTSYLSRFLIQHPDIYLPPRGESHFFATPDFPFLFKGPGDEGMNTEVIRTWDRYEMLFDEVKQERAIGESSGFYLYYPGTAARIFQARHTMKIIIMLRNPVERAFSSYTYLLRENRETLSFVEALKAEPQRKQEDYEPMWLYRELGLYYEQVKRYTDQFSKDQLKIILYDDFINDVQETMEDIFGFLGLYSNVPMDTSMLLSESGVPTSRKAFDFFAKPHFIKEVFKPFIPKNTRKRLGHKVKTMFLEPIDMSSSTKKELIQYYRPDILKLQKLIGKDLGTWLKK